MAKLYDYRLLLDLIEGISSIESCSRGYVFGDLVLKVCLSQSRPESRDIVLMSLFRFGAEV